LYNQDKRTIFQRKLNKNTEYTKHKIGKTYIKTPTKKTVIADEVVKGKYALYSMEGLAKQHNGRLKSISA